MRKNTLRAAGGEKCLTQARMQITQEQQDGGGSAYIYILKGSDFFYVLFRTYIKNKTEHLYCVCLRIQSDTLTRGYRISYSRHANKTVQRKKKKNWISDFCLHWILRKRRIINIRTNDNFLGILNNASFFVLYYMNHGQ